MDGTQRRMAYGCLVRSCDLEEEQYGCLMSRSIGICGCPVITQIIEKCSRVLLGNTASHSLCYKTFIKFKVNVLLQSVH